MRNVLIVAFGNPLAGDDGAGPAVLEHLERGGPPRGARLEEGGTDSLVLAGLWRGEPEIWIVDALRRDAPSGTVHRLEHDALLALPQTHDSAHRLSLPESLRWLALAIPGMAEVRYRFWGIEPGDLTPLRPLSPEVQSAVREVVGEILSQLEAPAASTSS